ncbi:MAG: MBL fold metallo-hydrolase [Myxococcaceae bacterium]
MPRALVFLALVVGAGCSPVSRSLRPDGLELVTLTHDNTNAVLVKKGDAAFLFDSGYEKNADQLEADLRALPFDPKQLKAIILSHGHADHAGAAHVFHQKFGTPVVLGSGDEAMYGKGFNEPLCPTGFIARSRLDTDQQATFGGSVADVLVSEDVDLEPLTGIPGKVLHVPGHTKGSLVVSVGDVLLVGDLLRGDIVGFGAETHFFMCDLEENRRNIAALLRAHPKAQVVVVGHFGPVTPLAVRQHFEIND